MCSFSDLLRPFIEAFICEHKARLYWAGGLTSIHDRKLIIPQYVVPTAKRLMTYLINQDAYFDEASSFITPILTPPK